MRGLTQRAMVPRRRRAGLAQSAGLEPIRIRVGAADLRIACRQAALHDAVRELYPAADAADQGDRAAPASLTARVSVRPDGRSKLGAPRYGVWGMQRRLFRRLSARELVPYLEWGLNWELVRNEKRFLLVHAATLVRENRAWLFVGGSGAGKSTVAAALLAAGWRYYGDELALIDPGTLRAHPFPKAICVKAGAFALVEQLGLPLIRRRHYVKSFKGPVGYIPSPTAAAAQLAPVRVAAVVLTQYGGQADAVGHIAPRGAAAFELTRSHLNRKRFGAAGAQRLCELVRQAACYSLAPGAPAATTALLESLHV